MKGKIFILGDVNSSHTRKWCEGLVSLGFEVALFTLSVPNSDWYTPQGIRLFSESNIPEEQFTAGDLSKVKYLQQLTTLKKAIASFGPDLVHAHYATSYGLLGAFSGKHPFVVSGWGSDVFDFPNRSFLHKLVIRRVFSGADLVIAPGKVMAAEIGKYTSKVPVVVPFGVDTGEYKPATKKTEDGITIGIIKSMEEYYGIDLLIDAFADVVKKFPSKNLKLLIVGGGTKLDEYSKKSMYIKLGDKITFTGRIKQQAVPGMLHNIDLFVNPSHRESFGVSVLEASSSGLPVIATSVGGLTEVVRDGVTGKLIPAGDKDALVNAISYFIEQPGELKRYGDAGRKFVEDNFDWKKILFQISDIYAQLSHTNLNNKRE